MLPHSRGWFDVWVESIYGPRGFWPNNVPADHFQTSATTGPVLAEAIGALLDRHPEVRAVIDIGAGSGELLRSLAAQRPHLRLTGVDLRPRPSGLDPLVGWVCDRWDVVHGAWTGSAATLLAGIQQPSLVLASEWLDDLPTPLAAWGADGWRELRTDELGVETLGLPLTGEHAAWARRWWPTGQRAEIGSTRDRAWAELVTAARPCGGIALMIDYGHLARNRPAAGSLAGYRNGRAVPPRPDENTNLTAHVAVDGVRAAGEARGAKTIWFARQSSVLEDLLPERVTAADPLADLVRRSQRAALGAVHGLGSHWWLMQR